MADSAASSTATKAEDSAKNWVDITRNITNSGSSVALRTPKNNLDKDAFLNLLVTQMKYQDPLNPMDDKQFIAQMAQFSSLEQMQNLNTSSLRSQAYSMMGRYVSSTIFNEKKGIYEDVVGKVEGVLSSGSKTLLRVGKKDIPIEDVEAVTEAYSQGDQLQNVSNLLAATQVLSLVGKYVQAITLDSKLNPKEFVEGQVDYVKFIGSTPVVMVGNKEIFAPEIVAISEEMMLIGKEIRAAVETLPEPIKGKIAGVTIDKGKTYLDVDGNKILINQVNEATESLKTIGQIIRCDAATGKVESVIIRKGVPYLVIGNKEVAYQDAFRMNDRTTEDSEKETTSK